LTTQTTNSRFVGIFLDFYGTVVGGDREAVESLCADLITSYNLDVSAADLAVQWGREFFAETTQANDSAFRNLFECECRSLQRTLARYGLRIDPAPYAEQLRRYWRKPEPLPGAAEALEALPVPVCIVSNADREDLLAATARLKMRCQHIVTSEDARAYKPHPGIFRFALKVTGWPAERVLHVGDSLYSDVGGARRLGLRAAWLDRPGRISDIGNARPDYRIRTLAELPALLKAIP